MPRKSKSNLRLVITERGLSLLGSRSTQIVRIVSVLALLTTLFSHLEIIPARASVAPQALNTLSFRLKVLDTSLSQSFKQAKEAEARSQLQTRQTRIETGRPTVTNDKNATFKQTVTYLYSQPKLEQLLNDSTFYQGHCTRFMASIYPIPWHGNGKNWLKNAEAMGYTIKDTPVAGDILVTAESSAGHVALVKAVDLVKEEFTIEEMNYLGWGKVSERTLSLKNPVIKGYIDGSRLAKEKDELLKEQSK